MNELDELLAFLANAIASHARHRQRNGAQVPPLALAVARWCLDAAQSGVERQSLALVGLEVDGGRMSSSEPSLLLTTRQVSRLLQVSERTVRAMADDGRLERVRVGGATRFRRADVDALVALPATSARFRDQVEHKAGGAA